MIRTPSQRGSHARRKGHRFEREIAEQYRRLGFDAKRGLQSRGGGKEVADVIGVPWFVECKSKKSFGSVTKAYNRAVLDANAQEVVLHLHETNGARLVVISEEKWFEMVRPRE